MVVEIIYIVVILLLLKIPFDLVRDIGYDYLELLSYFCAEFVQAIR